MILELQFFARDGILAGAQLGQEVFGALVKETVNPTAPTAIFLDFAKVQIATGSFLREGVLSYVSYVRTRYPFLYPVVANASSQIIEELLVVLQLRDEALVVCQLENHVVTDPKVIGFVEGKQKEALIEVISRGETDAPTLARLTPDQKPTIWNNRLSALAVRGLVMEIGTEKTKRYKTVLEGIVYGP
jgi:hypothetical protein